MSCSFPNIKNFSQRLTIEAPLLVAESGGERTYSTIRGKAKISCYSTQTWQKGAAITLCVLAIITMLIGVASLGGANIMGAQAAWAMVGSGLGAPGLIVGFMTINHLLFLKRVSKFLSTQNLEEWKDGNNYPGYDDDTELNNPKSEFEYTVGKKKIYGKRYGVCNCGITQFGIEFHRTQSIHQARTS